MKIYLFRKWSTLLRLLVWKIGPFGFPFGILLPLTILGLIQSWRKTPGIVLIFLGLFPLTVIAVHVCSRYRIPLIPIMIPLAAAGLVAFWDTIYKRSWLRVSKWAAIMMIVGIVTGYPKSFCREKLDYETELVFYRAYHAQINAQFDKVQQFYREVLDSNPEDLKSLVGLGEVLVAKGLFEEGTRYLHQAIAIEPEYVDAHRALGRALAQNGYLNEAIARYRTALEIDPGRVPIRYNLGLLLLEAGHPELARVQLKEALRQCTNDPRLKSEINKTLNNLDPSLE